MLSCEASPIGIGRCDVMRLDGLVQGPLQVITNTSVDTRHSEMDGCGGQKCWLLLCGVRREDVTCDQTSVW